MPSRSTSPFATQSPQPVRSLLSCIRSPFSSKSRKHLEFDIQPDDPHRQYSPGDTVTGSVSLKVVKPVRITHLVVCLVGYAQVFKTPNTSGDGYRANVGLGGGGKRRREGAPYGNGFASLFEDEVVLCGEGRLGEGVYQFNFELLFPKKSLPSSIDFERGTVSYMITATLTRPTTIATTTTCERKVRLVDDIDVGPLPPPKPRTISLEPVSRRSRARSARKRALRDEGALKALESGVDDTGSSRISESAGVVEESDVPGSPAPSDVSLDSRFSSTGTGSVRDSVQVSIRSGGSDAGRTSKNPTPPKRITASVDVQKAGFLRGDNIQVKVSVDHIKPIKSLHGVIVTFYRQARVDMHTAVSRATSTKGARDGESNHRSKKGLGSLSLSSAGSGHVFRKDMSQAFASLFVDPQSLKADIKQSVPVPPEAFPTISSVPGAMISFKYYVEVIVDLQGKLTGLDRVLANSGMIGVPTTYGAEPTVSGADDSAGGSFTAWGNNFIDTQPIRRDKSFATCVFEVIVGTRDSERRRGKRRDDSATGNLELVTATQQFQLGSQVAEEGDFDGRFLTPRYEERATPSAGPMHQPSYPFPEHVNAQDGRSYGDYAGGIPNAPSDGTSRPAAQFPLPSAGAEPEDEKERLRRAEMRLLPSQPPGVDAESSSTPSALHLPTAPYLPDDPAHLLAPPPSDCSSGNGVPSHERSYTPAAAAPEYEESSQAGRSAPPPTDDKGELQRRRLEEERSAPQAPADVDDVDALAPSALEDLAPSAPAFEDVYEFDETHGGELPRYER